MKYLRSFYLDKEKDMIVDLFRKGEDLCYVLKTPHHNTGNLIRNLARLCSLPLSQDENGLLVIRGIVPCYIDGYNRTVWVFRLGNTKGANIYGDGTVEMTAGKGDWNGKAVGAAVIAGCMALVPFCWPVALAAGTSAAVVVKNTVCQAKLPEDVCHYAAAFLS